MLDLQTFKLDNVLVEFPVLHQFGIMTEDFNYLFTKVKNKDNQVLYILDDLENNEAHYITLEDFENWYEIYEFILSAEQFH